MSDWIEVCTTDDIPRLEGRRVVVQDYYVGIFNTDEGFYAIGDVCPHMGGPLHDGMVENCIVACPLHSRTIDLRSGEVTNDLSRVLTFPVKLENGTVYLDADILPRSHTEEEGAA